MKDRIRQIMEHYGLSQQNFAAKLDISAATISSIFNGRTNPTNKQVQAIHRAFPEVDTNWLMFGEGEMMRPLASDAENGDGGAKVDNEVEALHEDAKLFSEPAMVIGTGVPSPQQSMTYGNAAQQGRTSRREAAMLAQQYGGMMDVANMIDKKPRKIKEIRVFFDDGTFEVFSPSSK